MRVRLSHQHISGSGIEIGGLHAPLHVKIGVKVVYVDRVGHEELKQVHSDVVAIPNNLVIDNAETLATFADNSQDFVIANHVFEHTEDPIKTIKNWLRVLKPGGTIYAAIPDKRQTFDRKRNCTPFSHLMLDHLNGPEASRMDHYVDWFQNADFPDAGINVLGRAQDAFEKQANIHFHVWDHAGIIEMFDRFQASFGLIDLEIHPNGSEVIVICKKGNEVIHSS